MFSIWLVCCFRLRITKSHYPFNHFIVMRIRETHLRVYKYIFVTWFKLFPSNALSCKAVDWISIEIFGYIIMHSFIIFAVITNNQLLAVLILVLLARSYWIKRYHAEKSTSELQEPIIHCFLFHYSMFHRSKSRLLWTSAIEAVFWIHALKCHKCWRHQHWRFSIL